LRPDGIYQCKQIAIRKCLKMRSSRLELLPRFLWNSWKLGKSCFHLGRGV
jgi:hypothetical protein